MKLTLQKLLISASLFTYAATSLAHEVWLEKDDAGPARVYLGEPGEPESGEHIDNLKGAKVFIGSLQDAVTLSREDDHWQAPVKGPGDVRLYIDSVWQPWSYNENAWWEFWKDSGDKLQGAILEARAGRAETETKLNFEITPTSAEGNEFVASFQGKALANQAIAVLTPNGDEAEISSDNNGKFSVDLKDNGRYLLSSVHTVAGEATHSDKTVHSLMYITSLSFVKK